MHNFFFNGKYTPETTVKDPIIDQDGFFIDCKNPIGSRDYSKGKSFRFWNWDDNKSRTFINDDFYQDLVRYGNSVWICVNTTTSIPGETEDWIEFIVDGQKGDPGEKGEKGESGNGNFEIGTGSPPPTGFVNDIYLDINTGNFYKFSNVWENVGQISINGSDINLENYYTKPEIDEYIEWQDD